jgi:hypothetical protein
MVDIPYGRILRMSPKGEFDVAAEYDGWPNGIAIHRDRRIFIADYRLGIMVLDPKSGRVESPPRVPDRQRAERERHRSRSRRSRAFRRDDSRELISSDARGSAIATHSRVTCASRCSHERQTA